MAYNQQEAKPGSALCDCGKWITLTKEGKFRSHTTFVREWPGSPFCKHCEKSGAKP